MGDVLPGRLLAVEHSGGHTDTERADTRRRGPPGPRIRGTRTVAGETVSRYPSPEQLGVRYQPRFDNTRRLEDLVAKLEKPPCTP